MKTLYLLINVAFTQNVDSAEVNTALPDRLGFSSVVGALVVEALEPIQSDTLDHVNNTPGISDTTSTTSKKQENNLAPLVVKASKSRNKKEVKVNKKVFFQKGLQLYPDFSKLFQPARSFFDYNYGQRIRKEQKRLLKRRIALQKDRQKRRVNTRI